MRIYPAIDIKDGKCVRLFKGLFSDVTVYGDNPVEMAKKWEAQGGEFLHVVDLDGALKGHGVNAKVIEDIVKAVKIPVQTGGGIRTEEDVKAKLRCGVERVIIGTSAVKDEEFIKKVLDEYKERIVIGIDAKNSIVAVSGWEEVSTLEAVAFAKSMEEFGATNFVYTDISTDGTLKGPNTKAMEEMAKAIKGNVIASGGIGNISHIRELINTGVEGVIVGKAIYTEAVDLTEAIKEAKRG